MDQVVQKNLSGPNNNQRPKKTISVEELAVLLLPLLHSLSEHRHWLRIGAGYAPFSMYA
jgi:hypothetical protein